MKEEIYKDVFNYEGLYQVSNFGNIKSFHHEVNGTVLIPTLNNTKRHSVMLCKGKLRKRWLIHRLVLVTFEGYSNNPEQIEVNHKDGNPLNNRLDNLEWVTHYENIVHRFEVLKHNNDIIAKPIDQFDLQGNYINTFSSAVQAENLLKDGTTRTGISKCLKGKYQTHNGYIFKKSTKI